MAYFLESGYTSLNKKNEELCGDKVESVRCGDKLTFVLADGMGSGVKANILSTLTSKILCTMVSNEIEIEDCLETIIGSLPVCKEREVAYSTFTAVHIDEEGNGYLLEFDNPQVILMRDGRSHNLKRERIDIMGRTVYKSVLALLENDVIVMFSDGVIHAGIGQNLNFGWERDEVMEHLECSTLPSMSARCIASNLALACYSLYQGQPGDDTTVGALKVRKKQMVNIMVGPPVNKEYDDMYVSHFLESDAKKVVCGGTSSQIVARYLKTSVDGALDFPDPTIPPIGYIEGIDLVTEGVITLRKLIEYVNSYLSPSDLSPKNFVKKDGASLLAQLLLEEATDVQFFVGQAMNEAHQGLPIDTTMKLKLVEKLANSLIKLGKNVEVNYA